jgi:hypothetical protein
MLIKVLFYAFKGKNIFQSSRNFRKYWMFTVFSRFFARGWISTAIYKELFGKPIYIFVWDGHPNSVSANGNLPIGFLYLWVMSFFYRYNYFKISI